MTKKNDNDFLESLWEYKKLEAIYIQYAINNDMDNFKIAYSNYENYNYATKVKNKKDIGINRMRSFVYDFRNATDTNIKMAILQMFLQVDYISEKVGILTLLTESNNDNNFSYFNSPELYQLLKNIKDTTIINEEYLKLFCDVLNKPNSIALIPAYIKQKDYLLKLINSENLNDKLETDLSTNEYIKKSLKL